MAFPTHARPPGKLKSKILKLQSYRGASQSLTLNLITSIFLFTLALLPRAYDLERFVTADEAKWVYRSAQFLAALLRGDFAATSVNLTPAVTTTWLGSAGLALYYQLHQVALNQPFLTWLTALPEFRVQLDLLAATRWPMLILTSLAVVALYLVVARLFYPALAFLAAVLAALDPHQVALARILGHDAPAAVFMSLSLLLLLLAVKPAGEQGSRGAGEISPSTPHSSVPLLLLSAVAAGLAFLSKAPALFLIPFAGLVLFVSEIHMAGSFPRLPVASLLRFLGGMLTWGAVAYLTFVLVWPAAWVDPLGRPAAVFQNAFLSATDQEEAGEEGFWRVPDLGPFYYLVNGGFKLSPLVLVGTGLAVFFVLKQRSSESANQRVSEPAKSEEQNAKNDQTTLPARRSPAPLPPRSSAPLLWLFAFALLFTLFMTLSDKRSPRYLLPVFPILAVIAAYGWLKLCQVSGVTYHALRTTLHAPYAIFIALLTLAAGIILLPYAPYYFTYYNPLLGGAYTAPAWVKIGWGEGLDQVGRFLQREGNLRDARVGAAYASTVAPYFEGDLAGVTGPNLDYVVLYVKQVQSGEPSPEFIRYFEQLDPIFSVNLNGIHYADIYPGPALQAVTADPEAGLSLPVAFRPLTVYGHMGETLEVDVVWRAAGPLTGQPVNLALVPPATTETLAQGQAVLTGLAGDLAVSRHRLTLPANLTPGPYTLLVKGQPLGQVELRNFKAPQSLTPLQNLTFGRQVAVAAFAMTPNPDYIGVTLAWQARQAHLPDYTVFVQLLNAATGERAAGVDAQPRQGQWPTSRWVNGEVVTDEYLVAVPPDFKPGVYKVIVGLYRPETGQRLTLPDGQDHWTLPYSFIRD